MITAAAVCPHPPLLLRELSGLHDVGAELRAACHAAVEEMLTVGPDRVVVVGDARSSAAVDATMPVAVRRFGTADDPDLTGLPQSLGVAKRLLVESGWAGRVEMHAIARSATPAEASALATRVAGSSDRVALLVLGDGSTRRGEKAPGYLDERAFPFDEATGTALASGDLDALLEIDPVLSDELMVSGRAPWQVLAAAVRAEGSTVTARSLYRDDPYGVMYHVVGWQLS